MFFDYFSGTNTNQMDETKNKKLGHYAMYIIYMAYRLSIYEYEDIYSRLIYIKSLFFFFYIYIERIKFDTLQ